jgi:hypothetical protein
MTSSPEQGASPSNPTNKGAKDSANSQTERATSRKTVDALTVLAKELLREIKKPDGDAKE